jgi:hypothetical protein
MDLALPKRWISGDETFGQANYGSSVSPIAIVAAVVLRCWNRRIHHLWLGLDYGQADLDSFRNVVHGPPFSSPGLVGYGVHNFSYREYGHFFIKVDETLRKSPSYRSRELRPDICLYLQIENRNCSRDMAYTLLDCGRFTCNGSPCGSG